MTRNSPEAGASNVQQPFKLFSDATPLSRVYEQVAAGAGWLMFDLTLDPGHLEAVRRMVAESGRETQLLELDLSTRGPARSIGILDGAATDIAATLVSLMPPAPADCPGAEFYQNSAHYALGVLVAATQAAGLPVRLRDLAELLVSAEAIQALERRVPSDVPAYARLQGFLDMFRTAPPAGTLDIAKLKGVLGGMAGRIAQYAQGRFAIIFDSDNPDIRLDDVVRDHSMLYVRLPAGDALAQQVSRVIVTAFGNALERAGAPDGGLAIE
jgi:hypothetical protein